MVFPEEIATTRLRIIPLALDHFALLLDEPAAMETALGLERSGTALRGHELEAMSWLYDMARTHPGQHLWFTNWQIVLVAANMSIGSACFKGCPDEKGEVEIGYGINADHRKQGYMTEAAEALCRWAMKQPGVRSVIAETDKDNPASQRVCLKSGMEKTGETSSTLLWRFGREG